MSVSELCLEIDSVSLRDWTMADIEIYTRYQETERPWIEMEAPWLQKNGGYSHELEEIKNEVLSFDPALVRRSMVISNNEGKFIGLVTSYWRGKETYWMRIGIRICDNSYWGKGIGREALKLWINYLFLNRPELSRLGMTTWSGNKSMVKIASKLGFSLEACHRKARFFNNQYYDAIGYGILKEEWLQREK